MINHDKKIIIGRFGKTFGIKGWLRVISFTDPPENILEYDNWLMQTSSGFHPIVITDGKLHGQEVLVKPKDTENPESARLLTNHNIAILREQLPTLEPNEYYWTDLEGLTVINQAGITLGKIQTLFATGANDVMVIKGEQEHLIPYTHQVVKNIDLESRKMTVDWVNHVDC